MRFTVIGAGAIGGSVGAQLARNGHDVLLCDVDREHVAAIRAHGLTIEGPVAQFTVRVAAVEPADLPGSLEGTVIVAVKSHHTADAAQLLRGRLADDAQVLSLQNGLTTGTLAQAVGIDRIIVGFVNFGADLMSPGRILLGNRATFRIGEPGAQGRPINERVRELAAALPGAVATDSIEGYLWAKEAYGAMLFATAVSDLSIADVFADPTWRPLLLAVASEVLAQAPVTPLPFDGFDPADLGGSIDRLETFNRASAKSHTGIYRDLMIRRRPTEVGELLDGLTGPLTAQIGMLIRAIERGERTCEVANLELLAAYERLERLGRPLNAVVATPAAPPRAASGPLHGMPIAVKDMVDVAGWPRGNGNPHEMAGPAAQRDAPIVARLRSAGADVFALASLLEYAAGAPHPDLPEARNPVDPSRTAGGSSGGSAALVGAGVCPAALGTDSGGSIRIPAHYCGIVGFKPTHGLLPLAGVQPLAPTLDHLGVLGRDVTATTSVMAALGGVHSIRPSRPLRIGLLVDQLGHRDLDPGSAGVLAAAVEALAAGGCQLDPVTADVLADLLSCFEAIVLYEAWQSLGARARREPAHFGAATLRLLLAGSRIRRADYEQALARRADLIPAADDLAGSVDVLFGPAVPFPAPLTTPPVDTPQGELEGLFSAAYNVSGQPAIVLPAGRTPAGLPVGLQLAAARGNDGELLGVAAVVEDILAQARGGGA